MNSRRMRYVAGLLFGCFVLPVYAGINTGMWEITVKMNMMDMPMDVPPQVSRQCLKKENLVPSTQTQQECKIISHGVKGNTVTWEMTCNTPQGVSKGKGKMTFRGDRMTGQTTITMPVDGGTVNMTNNLSGRRIGDCN